MISRLTDNNKGIAIIVDSDSEFDSNPFCPNCQDIGKLSRLKERIYLDDKGKLLPPQPDAENFLMCYLCGLIIPTHEVQKEGKITGISGVEVIDNPFDFGKKVIKGLDNRKLQSRLKNKKRKTKEKQHPDKDIQKYLNDGWEVTSYLNSMPPPT
jgi:hypothetical protein